MPRSELGRKLQKAIDKPGCRNALRRVRWHRKYGYKEDEDLFYNIGKMVEFKKPKARK